MLIFVGTSPETNKGSARKRIAPFAYWIAGLVLLLILGALPLLPCLTISAERGGGSPLYLGIKPGELFYLRYTHSVNLSDVTDGVEWTGSTLMLRSTLFTAYGVGMPVLADGIGSSFQTTPDGFLITGIDRPEERILLLMQEVPHYRLLYRDRTIDLLDRYESGSLLCIEVRRISLWTSLLHLPCFSRR